MDGTGERKAILSSRGRIIVISTLLGPAIGTIWIEIAYLLYGIISEGVSVGLLHGLVIPFVIGIVFGYIWGIIPSFVAGVFLASISSSSGKFTYFQGFAVSLAVGIAAFGFSFALNEEVTLALMMLYASVMSALSLRWLFRKRFSPVLNDDAARA